MSSMILLLSIAIQLSIIFILSVDSIIILSFFPKKGVKKCLKEFLSCKYIYKTKIIIEKRRRTTTIRSAKKAQKSNIENSIKKAPL